MNPDILKPKEENLFSLAAEMGLVVMTDEALAEKSANAAEETSVQQKPYSQLT